MVHRPHIAIERKKKQLNIIILTVKTNNPMLKKISCKFPGVLFHPGASLKQVQTILAIIQLNKI
jgi:hypothetical protein